MSDPASQNVGLKLNRQQLASFCKDDYDMLKKFEDLFTLFSDVSANSLSIGEIDTILRIPIEPLPDPVGADTTYTLADAEAESAMHQVFIPASSLVATAAGPFTLTITTGSGDTVKVPISVFGDTISSPDLLFDIYVDSSGNVTSKDWEITGSNALGTYSKRMVGKMECWAVTPVIPAAATAVMFPVTFIAAPVVIPNINWSSASAGNPTFRNFAYNATTTGITIFGAGIETQYHALGDWRA